jgi:hypothetical protein
MRVCGKRMALEAEKGDSRFAMCLSIKITQVELPTEAVITICDL